MAETDIAGEQLKSTAAGTAVAIEPPTDLQNPIPQLKEVLLQAKTNPNYDGAKALGLWVRQQERALPTDLGPLDSEEQRVQILENSIGERGVTTSFPLLDHDVSAWERTRLLPNGEIYIQDVVSILQNLGVISEATRKTALQAGEQYRYFETKWLLGLLDPDLSTAIYGGETINQLPITGRVKGDGPKIQEGAANEKGVVEIRKSTKLPGVDVVVGIKDHILTQGGHGTAGMPIVNSVYLEFTPAALVAAITAQQSPNQ